MISRKMLHLVWIWIGFLLLYLQKSILCDTLCGERRTVNGTVGKDVILGVEHDGIMGDITWLSAGNHFATTGRGGFIKVRDKRYRGKVYAMADGSLNITKLVRADQGTYTASTLRNSTTKTQLCAQYYELRVYSELLLEDVYIEHVFVDNETCSMAITCKVNESDVTVTWSHSTLGDVALTANTLYVYDPDPEVTVTCSAQNPINAIYKSVTPWDYCKQGKNDFSTERILSPQSITGRKGVDYTILNFI
ncbi:SLAM family member 5-like isoform X2 [Pyxicephalus adspersus]|uniref:SLAM family member 5-like isoform X2 n=1 Tax=Pyxicephalus adspersus TaxID=30357 RepID=UPI003B595114